MKRLYVSLSIILSYCNAVACLCPDNPYVVSYMKADFVFYGNVLKLTGVDNKIYKARIEVLNRYKNDLPKTIEVYTHKYKKDCGFRFLKGERYIIYSTHTDSHEFWVDLCSNTKKIRLNESENEMGLNALRYGISKKQLIEEIDFLTYNEIGTVQVEGKPEVVDDKSEVIVGLSKVTIVDDTVAVVDDTEIDHKKKKWWKKKKKKVKKTVDPKKTVVPERTVKLEKTVEPKKRVAPEKTDDETENGDEDPSDNKMRRPSRRGKR